jgi:hypothetical protein
MLIRKIYAFGVTIAGAILTYRGLRHASREVVIVGLLIAGVFYLFYLVPMIVFGATIETKERGVRVRQYTDVEIPYAEIRACFAWLLPPFDVLILITTRRFPLCCVVAGQSKSDRESDLEGRIKQRSNKMQRDGKPISDRP